MIGAPAHIRETVLLERDGELVAIDRLLDSSGDGTDPAVLIVGHPGLGKTCLCEVALARARARGLLALRAAGSELEQSFAFGVAGQLLRSLRAATPPSERAALLRDAPSRIRALEREGPGLTAAGPEEGLALAHGLFSVLAAAAETRPALVVIDDLHWCDADSLEFVLYLLHRLPELPVSLLLASRLHEPDGGALDRIAAHRSVRVRTLAPLAPEAVTEMVSRELGGAQTQALTDACMRATAGNPFYLHEVLLALAADRSHAAGELERRVREFAPEAVTRAARMRTARLGPDAARLARAVAILGDEASLHHAAALAELDLARAGAAADGLRSVEVLSGREPLRFVHPLVRTAIEQDIPASERASRHLEAARLLAGEGASVERIAAHLLRGRAQGDPWAVQQLRDAAAQARSRGSASAAVAYLKRALAEPAPVELRGELLAELGSAEAALGLEDADEHLALAIQASPDPRVRAEIALMRGKALASRGRFEPAANAFKDGLELVPDAPSSESVGELRDRLQAGLVLNAVAVPSLQAEALRISAELLDRTREVTAGPGQRLVLAQATVQAAFGGRPAHEVVDLAARAWDQGRLLENETAAGTSWILVTAALCLAGDLELSLRTAEKAAANARALSAPLAFATASYMRVVPQLWQGNIDGALADLELARDARRYGWRQYARSAAASYCLCMIEKGELDRADAALTEDGPISEPYDGEDALRLYALAELRRAQGQAADAFEIALTSGEVAEGTIPYLGYCPWRSSAIQSALALGRRDGARELAQQELERSQATQVLHNRIRALRLTGLSEGGEDGLAALRGAVELGEAHAPRLETIHALVALGSALRRRNKPTAAREPLERAYELARRGGAAALQQFARTELLATGARPRREALTGAESLTPSERRIAELAAGGRSNRDIAHTLFVTPKTVEYHLRNAYRKLAIQTRRELKQALHA